MASFVRQVSVDSPAQYVWLPQIENWLCLDRVQALTFQEGPSWVVVFDKKKNFRAYVASERGRGWVEG